ncbi:3-oxoacyl-[acyl-carrier-protein] reductase [Salinispora oceanensis]|uniref:3-oxoacyl-[acyl-carrier-protein] reductase n=1 Tax=Salinispora oceanensis TaxID=1050199 RepID=UPI00036A4039|nr:3-oxoacyl-[acyl-carrier-protein] reductase [Salinispora oceanensis]
MGQGCAVVTGGSRGIGRAVALRLAADQLDVAFCSRSRDDAAEETLRLVEKAGGRAFHLPCDVTDPASVKQFLAEAERQLGQAQVLVNSAGILRDKPLALMSPDDWATVVDTNLNGVFNVCRAVVRGMIIRRGGAIVNVSSVAGVTGNIGQTNYSASKAGLIGFSRALAKEVASYGIRVNVVAPGFIDTDMTATMTEAARRATLSKIPLGRFGTAEAVAELIRFLAADQASYITGQVMRIDGGLVL